MRVIAVSLAEGRLPLQPIMISFCFCSREHRNTSTWLQRALVLEELSPTLRSTNFSCLFVDPGQVAQDHIILAQLWVRNLKEGIQGWEELSVQGRKYGLCQDSL